MIIDVFDYYCEGPVEKPFGLFRDPDPPPEFSVYMVRQLFNPNGWPCPLYFKPYVFREPIVTGGQVYWRHFDGENAEISIWRYSPAYNPAEPSDEHSHLPFTTLEAPAGLYEFVVADDKNQIAWGQTFPGVAADGFLYNIEIWTSDLSGEDVRQLLSVIETDMNASDLLELELIGFTDDGERLLFSLQKIGIGTQWPGLWGRYDNLYEVDLAGGEPRLLFDCGNVRRCVADISADGTKLLYQLDDQRIVLLDTTGGEEQIIETGGHDFAGGALLGPSGALAFLAVDGDNLFTGSPIADAVTIFYTIPPYNEVRPLISNPDIRALIAILPTGEVLYIRDYLLDPEGTPRLIQILAMVNLEGEENQIDPNLEPRFMEALVP
jgi:hypothetical protein